MTVTNEMRKVIVESYTNGYGVKQISSMLNLKYTTVYAIISIFQKEDRIVQKVKGGQRKKRLNEMHINAIKGWIDNDCGITLKCMKNKLFEEFCVTVCEKTVDNCISSFSYTLKRITLIPERRNNEKSIVARYEYALQFFEILSSINEDHIFFIDEVGFNVSMRYKKGRSLVNTPAVQIVPGLKSRNISVCCAMTRNGITFFNRQTKAFQSLTFGNFVDDLFIKIKELNIIKAVVVMDNVPFHKHQSIKAKFAQSGHILLFLPPYSPFLNPIENMFAKWKTLIRGSKPTSEQHLFELIDSCSHEISSENCSGFFRNVFTFLPKCLNKEEIVDGN